MGRLKNFFASIKLSAGLKPKGDFALMEAHDLMVDEDGARLDDVLFDKDTGARLDKRVKSIEKDVKDLKEHPSGGGSVSITYDSKTENITIKQEEQ